MIPYHDLERAIARWKVRQAGGDATVIVESPPQEVVAEAVIAEAYAVEVVTDVPSGHVTLDEEDQLTPPAAEPIPAPKKKRR